MDSLDIFQNNCRICLEKPGVLNWNEEIPDFCDATYKYCYFIYTQLDDQDVFPQMLCESCASDLRQTHFLIQKALESHKILQQTLQINIEVDEDIEHQVLNTIDFETVIYKQSTEFVAEVQNSIKDEFTSENFNSSKVSNLNKEIEHHNDDSVPDDLEQLVEISQSNENLNSLSGLNKRNVRTRKATNRKHMKMCPYCSKFLRAGHLKSHEETHKADRERTEICPVCGIKLFNKANLQSHMLTHQKNREKKYKCEFCEKSYFNRGGLTVHQRIHLGQMIPCPICAKEFPRQTDLDRHNVKAHSASLLHDNFEKNKYVVECKDCGKNIPSHKWKYHRDTHLKKFQMKCTLCDKHFVTKSTCHKHVKKVHKKNKEDYAKVVLYYGENIDMRTSHLMIKQTEELKPFSE